MTIVTNHGYYQWLSLLEGSLEVKLSRIWTDEAAEVREQVVFLCVVALEDRKAGSQKLAGADLCAQMWNQKLHAAVAQSRFGSQNAQTTAFSEHLRKFRCRKSARDCSTKHISKSKVLKLTVSDHFWKSRCQKSARNSNYNYATTTATTTTTITTTLRLQLQLHLH